MKKLKIKQQILFSLVFITFLSVTLLGLIVYNVSKKTMINHYIASQKQNLEISNNVLDMQLKEVIDNIRNELFNENLISVLNFHYSSNIGEFLMSDKFALQSYVKGIIEDHSIVEGMSIVSKDGKRFFYYKSVLSGNLNKFYYNNDILKAHWIKDTYNAQGREVFYPNDILQDKNAPYFSMSKKIINPNNQKFLGYMVVTFKKDMFKDTFGRKKLAESKDSVLILNNKEIVFEDKKLDNILDFINGSREKYIYSSYYNVTTGWELYNIISLSSLNDELNNIKAGVIMAAVLLLVVSIILSNIIASTINTPLKELEVSIEKIGIGDRQIQMNFDNSEIGLIGQKFQSMVRTNIELKEDILSKEINEKEAQLLLLHAQINSHFLYNTLDSIYCMAIIDDNNDIANMVEALANVFRFSLNKGEKEISIADEIDFIKNYIRIQNIRYKNRFSLLINVDKNLYSRKIIRFLIQPFVENAMYHGLEPKVGKGELHIIIKPSKDGVSITVKDNGVGVENIDVFYSGYGVKNIKERLELYYKNKYELTFESKKNVGTKVNIVIPLES
ncbi:MAG: sensor histidine kinase [Lachnospirales bacterium]